MRGRGHSFRVRNCWLCGEEITKLEDADFFIPGDYKGVCKSHHLKEILSVKSDLKISQELRNKFRYVSLTEHMGNLKGLGLKKKIIFKIKTVNKMKRKIINAFLAIAAIEILWHLPHVLNLLINKIK